MSKIYENDFGIYISHEKYISFVFRNLDKGSLNPNLFDISSQYKSKKLSKSRNKSGTLDDTDRYGELRREQEDVKTKFQAFVKDASSKPLSKHIFNGCSADNKVALETAETIYQQSGKVVVQNAFGSNRGPAVMKEINDSVFLFPQNSTFYAKDVYEMNKHLVSQSFDVILLDPPWWNKYIRRKRKKSPDAYDMMFNEDLKNLPIEKILKDDGLVVVWCTNSEQNFNYLINDIFPKWEVEFSAKWYWMKVTTRGEPVCDFSAPPGKQPYEKIVFGCRKRLLPLPKDRQLVISVPSALHSHKPPLVELLNDFLPENPSCLEVFARYLLPDWTSYGNEVLRLQHVSLYVPSVIK